MAQLAIIFTTNRVVRRLTTDAAPPLTSDESAVTPATPVVFSDFTGGRVKLDGSNNPVQATLAEWQAAGLDDAFNTAQALTRFNDYKGAIDAAVNWGLPQGISLGAFQTLTNVGAAYDTVANAKGLGIALVDFTGCSGIRFDVFVNKVGSGTQSWQLWNDTDGSQIAVIDDAGATGDKVLTMQTAAGLPTGVKRVRVRAKSTTAADDPVFYGAALGLQYDVIKTFFNRLKAILT